MKGSKIAAIASKAKIADVKHTVKLDVLKDKWSKAKPLKVIEDKVRNYKEKPLTKKEIAEIKKQEKQKRLDELEQSLKQVTINNFVNLEQANLTFEQVKQRKKMLNKLKKLGLI